MDPRLLQFYIQELAHVRDTGAEFAARFPKVASRLAMDATEVQDPYVERLLEGFAFLTARVQLRLNEEFPRFTEQLLNCISPNFLAPVPAMGVVQLNPNHSDVALKKGISLSAGTVLQSQVAKGINTPCKFRVGHSLTLWPLVIQAIEHGPFKAHMPTMRGGKQPRSALLVTIENSTNSALSQLPLDELDFHVSCGDEYAYALLERLCHQTVSVGIRAPEQVDWQWLPLPCVAALGLDDSQALLPVHSNQFSGMRLLQEFFAFPARFLFFRVQGLRRFLASCQHSTFQLAFCFAEPNTELDRVVGVDSLALNCTPVVNLFEQNCDRVLLDERLHEVQVQPNRSKPHDFEVHSVLGVQGYGQNKVQELPPLYAVSTQANTHNDCETPRFVHRRVPTLLSEKQVREGGRSSYSGSDVYLGLTLPTGEFIQTHGLEQLAVKALCTNRDLPLLVPVGQGPTDLAWPGNLPVHSIRFLRGPSRPKAAMYGGQSCWQLIEHLSLNYLGLIDQDALALGQLLALHADAAQQAHQHMARAILAVESQPLVSRVVRQGRPAVVRGLLVTLTLDELALQGTGALVLGSVLAFYLASHVSVNSFVQTRVRLHSTGAVFDFPARSGNRPLL
ncbi:MAG: type VI secretion system baseplate subunit TssF [Betaproteobacteria bacterium]|jgi:type VI secretion system protein ImpG|nr:MAG: type VI secretion system baseplate subunit TssF [Betaproteobacteria bacterium]PZO22381.1 MAG: type VI secretion system baseplate subunit TssF [Betaproteobacteria bacterium]PZO29704.1 MAG: type VI secretion system baseplate subunit TssF [Betaproteobacteria bacterium]